MTTTDKCIKSPFKTILSAIIAAVFLIWQFTSPCMAAPQTNQKYSYGIKLYQYDLEPGESVADSPIPGAVLGAFTLKNSEFQLKDVIDKIGIPSNSGRLYRAVGYLNVKEPMSSYNISIVCNQMCYGVYGNVFIDGRLVAAKYERSGNLVLNAPVSFNNPGVYPVDIRLYSNLRDEKLNVLTSGFSTSLYSQIKLLIKTPDNDMPLPAHRVLLQKLDK